MYITIIEALHIIKQMKPAFVETHSCGSKQTGIRQSCMQQQLTVQSSDCLLCLQKTTRQTIWSHAGYLGYR